MKSNRIVVLGLIIGCLISFLGGSFVWAGDYYIEKQTETLLDGKPSGNSSVLKMWVKQDKIRYLNESDKNTVLIIHMDQDKAYQLNEQEKTAREIDLKAQFAALEKEIEVHSKKTGKTKKIGQWDAYQVIMTSTAKGIPTDVEYWLSDAVKVPKEIRSKMAVYFGQKKIVSELNKYSGYPVEITVHMDAQNKKLDMVTRLVKVEEKEIDGKLFDIPPGYKIEGLLAKEEPKASPQSEDKKSSTSGQQPASAAAPAAAAAAP
ncbi:MAG: DUF4412 domain-containing protein [bacterium]|nr:DUF4412 domain-containing protein [bacterium]